MRRLSTKIVNLSNKVPFQLALVAAMASLPLTATADPRNITESEWKLIPRYCPDTLAYSPTTSSGYKSWEARMGPSFKHMHHYCWAQIHMIRAMKAGVPAQTRQAFRISAQSDYWYVINNSPPSFVMLPEIYTRLGEVELLLKRPKDANEAFARGRQLKPDYWPAYSHWAEFLIRAGKQAEAKQLLQTGLEYSPTAKVLIEQYRMVGGNPSAIVPKPIKTEAESTVSTPAATTPEGKDAVEQKTETPTTGKTAD